MCMNLFQLMICCVFCRDGKIECCNNHYQTNNTCVECPNGTHGWNCSLNCFENTYGKLCLKACNCKPYEKCDPKNGHCSVKPGYCRNNTGNSELHCCNNYFYVNTICKECPIGTFGTNCSQICPNNYYGKLCKKECQCEPIETCDPREGCKECPIGTYGINCSQICPYGYYGKLCTETCKCQANEKCDPKNGCIDLHHQQSWGLNLVVTIASVISASVLFFCFYCVGQCIRRNYRRKKPASQKFADIPLYRGGAHGTCNKQTTPTPSNHPFDESDDFFYREHGNTDETDEGVYHTLTLRVTGYEEPVRRNQLIRCHSDVSSTYTKGFIYKRSSTTGALQSFPDCKKYSSLRIRDTDRKDHVDKYSLWEPFEEKSDEPGSSKPKNDATTDTPVLQDGGKVENMKSRHQFLKELSSRLLNDRNTD